MTREEAVKKLLNLENKQLHLSHRSSDHLSVIALLDMLEALGLIKFAETKPRYVFKSSEGVEYKILDTFIRIEN